MSAHPTPPVETPGDRVRNTIRGYMAIRRTSGPKLARDLGISSQILYDRLNGGTKISVDEVDAIAQILDVSIADLFAGRISRQSKYAAWDSNPEPTVSGLDDTSEMAA